MARNIQCASIIIRYTAWRSTDASLVWESLMVAIRLFFVVFFSGTYSFDIASNNFFFIAAETSLKNKVACICCVEKTNNRWKWGQFIFFLFNHKTRKYRRYWFNNFFCNAFVRYVKYACDIPYRVSLIIFNRHFD